MIWHVYKDLRDPAWGVWDLEREDGKSSRPANTLGEIRAAHGVALRRGTHPEPGRRGPIVSGFIRPDGSYGRSDFRCWWFEDGEKSS